MNRPILAERDVADLISNLKADIERRAFAIECEVVLELIDAGHHLHEAVAIVRSRRPGAELAAIVADINEIERVADRVRLGTN